MVADPDQSGTEQPFGTRVLVFDDVEPDPITGVVPRVPAVPIADADRNEPVCLTADGTWMAVTPSETGEGPVVVSDQVVYVTGERPEDGHAQLILYTAIQESAPTDSGDDAGANDDEETSVGKVGVVQLRVLEFCSSREDCPSTVSDWTKSQLGQTARRSAPAIVLLVLGGWLIALSFPRVWTTSIGALRAKVRRRWLKALLEASWWQRIAPLWR